MIKRRRLVALVSALVVVAIVVVALATGMIVMRTSYGQDKLRRAIQAQIAGGVRGKVYLGEMSGGFLTGVVIDSFAIRDADNDSLLLSTGRITANYDPRDLIDKRVWLRNVEVEHPVVYLRQHTSGRWNFKEIFKSYDKKTGPQGPGTGFGKYVVIDSARVRDATFVLQMPWSPDDSLRGARRDSAIRFNTTRADKEIRRVTDEGKPAFMHTWRWTKLDAVVSRIRLADPDSDRFGRLFVIDSLSVAEHDPPFAFRNVRGQVRHKGDSIWLDVKHFDLPASTGSATGKVVWGSDLPVRYDISVTGDSVALADVAWVYPTLPTTGGGKVLLHIGNERENLHIIDYKLAQMDVRSTGSHLIGDMTFAVGGPVLVVKDVKMSAQPFDFDLLRTLNGKPFPVDWRGQLYGSVRARGGPLNEFVVDESEVVFRDAHVPGAASRVGGRGGLDILQPAFTAFHGFAVNAASVDLRSIEFLYPNFPRLGGTISGTATLDSSWLDVRFANADVTHRDGPGEPTHLTGSGRVTWGEQFMTYDIDAQAQPLSLTTLARSYPKMPLMGVLTGPLKAKGTIADLQVTTALTGAAGALTFDGRVDAYPPGYAIRGAGDATGLALHALLDGSRLKSAVRPTVLTGHYDVALAGDSLANLEGSAALDVQRADVDGLRVYPSRARLRFADGRLRVDTLRLETTAATIVAAGALGLPHGASDSLRLRVVVDSLGGLRRYLGSSGTSLENGAVDSLAGSVTLDAVARGRVDSLDLAGTLAAAGLYLGKDRGRSATGTFALRNVLAEPAGRVTFRLDTITVAGVLLDSVTAVADLAGRTRAAFDVDVHSDNGPTAHIAGSAISIGGTIGDPHASTRVALDAIDLAIGESRWKLLGVPHLVRDSLGLALDSLVLIDGKGARIAARGVAPMHAPVSLDLRADSVALADIGVLAQLEEPARGRASLDVHVGGMRDRPEITIRSQLDSVGIGGVNVERTALNGTYRDRSLEFALDFYRNRQRALRASASVPVAITLFGAKRLDAPIRGAIRADSADLAVLEMLSPSARRVSGRLTANVDFSISRTRRSVGGLIAVRNGQMLLQNLGITLRAVNGDVRFDEAHDSVRVDLAAVSGANASSRIALRGSVNYADWDDPRFALALFARNFHALDRKSLATLDVSTGADSLRLAGSMNGASLSGNIRVDRGAIYLPERDIARKQVVDLSGEDLFQIIDTTDYRTRRIIPDAPSQLVQKLVLEGVSVDLGDEVWLRSREANIKLGGSLNLKSARQQGLAVGRGARNARDTLALALEGALTANRGTYTLDLGPVQRDFDVQSGTITFFGTADLNPYVDISATHSVKRASQNDLAIRVHLVGPLIPSPSLELTSSEPFLSTSDLVSYLVTGQPTFALSSQTKDVVNQASAALFPTLTSVAANTLRNSVGSWVDLLQFQGGAPQTTTSGPTLQSFRDFVSGARLGGEKQISNNLFFSFSTGLCALGGTRAAAGPEQTNFVEALGGKLEYRFNPQFSVQAGTEPKTEALYCGHGTSLANVVSTPRQWGLSFLRTWHF